MLFLEFLQKLSFYYNLTLAFMPLNDYVLYHQDSLWAEYISRDPNYYYVSIDVEIATPKDMFFVGGSFKTVFAPRKKDISNVVLRNVSLFNTGFRFNRFEIGFKHYCTHPVAFYIDNMGNDYSIHGAYEEIYISFSNKR